MIPRLEKILVRDYSVNIPWVKVDRMELIADPHAHSILKIIATEIDQDHCDPFTLTHNYPLEALTQEGWYEPPIPACIESQNALSNQIGCVAM
jgi:hypothetical protein